MRTRDQERALHVYDCVTRLDTSLRGDYKVMAKDLGANIMRSGLCAALAFIHRDVKERAARAFLDHLTAAMKTVGISALGKVARGDELFAAVRELELADYMLVTREMLRLAIWFRRAVDTFEEA
jgi:CRISPR-associated protein Cmr5